MSNQAERLAAVQEVDIRIIRLQKELSDIPVRQKAIETGSEQKKESFRTAKSLLTARQSETRQLELDVEAENQKIRKLREQQLQLKSNKEFKAMDDEIRTIMARIAKLEEKQLLHLEEVDKATAVVGGAKQVADKIEQEKQSELATLDGRRREIEAELQKLTADRAARATEVDPRWLSRYEPMIKTKKERVLVKVEHGVCGGCNMTLAPHMIHDARRGDLMISCSFCGRLLY